MPLSYSRWAGRARDYHEGLQREDPGYGKTFPDRADPIQGAKKGGARFQWRTLQFSCHQASKKVRDQRGDRKGTCTRRRHRVAGQNRTISRSRCTVAQLFSGGRSPFRYQGKSPRATRIRERRSATCRNEQRCRGRSLQRACSGTPQKKVGVGPQGARQPITHPDCHPTTHYMWALCSDAAKPHRQPHL